MSAINLVPRSLLSARLWRSRLEAAIITAAITVTASVGVWLIVLQQATDAELRTDQLSAATVSPLKQALSSADSADTLLRVSTLNTLVLAELNWPQALSDVGALVPKDIKLTTYSYALAATKVTLVMGGQSKTASAFASFASAMQEDSRFSSVHVDSYTYAPTTGLVSFTMTAVRDSSQLMYHPPK